MEDRCPRGKIAYLEHGNVMLQFPIREGRNEDVDYGHLTPPGTPAPSPKRGVVWVEIEVSNQITCDLRFWDCFRTIPGTRIPPEMINWDVVALLDDWEKGLLDDEEYGSRREMLNVVGSDYPTVCNMPHEVNKDEWRKLSIAIKQWSQADTGMIDAQHPPNTPLDERRDVSCGILIYPRKVSKTSDASLSEQAMSVEAATLAKLDSASSTVPELRGSLTSSSLSTSEVQGLADDALGYVMSNTVGGGAYDAMMGEGGYMDRWSNVIDGSADVPVWEWEIQVGFNTVKVDMAEWIPGHPEFGLGGSWYGQVKTLIEVAISMWAIWRLWLMFVPATAVPGWQRQQANDN